MIIDTDMHSHVSRSSAWQMVQAARQKGLRVLGLSEHVFQMQETRLALQHLEPEGPLRTFNTYIEDARKALPNAIVAMGTSNESTLMVVGQEQTKDSLEASANGVEKRLREIYSNYRMISRRKTVVGGAPAIEFKYSGMADEHLWSGTLVVVSRGKDVLTLLGMTYADNDLIQIQENVIARAISSTDFDVH